MLSCSAPGFLIPLGKEIWPLPHCLWGIRISYSQEESPLIAANFPISYKNVQQLSPKQGPEPGRLQVTPFFHPFSFFIFFSLSFLKQVISTTNLHLKKIQAGPSHEELRSNSLWGTVLFAAGGSWLCQQQNISWGTTPCSGSPPQGPAQERGGILKALKSWRNCENSSPGPHMG